MDDLSEDGPAGAAAHGGPGGCGPARFEDLGLEPRVLEGVRGVGFEALRPIQAAAIPVALAGRDVLGLARTGTGKTAAFALPILDRLARGGAEPRPGPRPGPGRPRALVLAPTRELSAQIADDFARLGAPLGVRPVLVIGGVNAGPQRDALAASPDVVVATTGRLLDHVRAGTVDLAGVEVLVLDEADRMVDMGFLPDVRAVIDAVGGARQTMMFSATMPPEVQALAQGTLRDPRIIDLGGGLPAETIDHSVVLVHEGTKPRLLRALLDAVEPGARVIVFVRTKQRSKAIAYGLEKRGASVALLHGDRGQSSRAEALARFRSGDATVLVATDLASRGLDVEGVALVVNHDVPLDPDQYVHRIGRTGRAERAGQAITFVGEGDLSDLRAIEFRIGARIGRRAVGGFPDLEDEDLTGRDGPGRRRRGGAAAARRSPARRSRGGRRRGRRR